MSEKKEETELLKLIWTYGNNRAEREFYPDGSQMANQADKAIAAIEPQITQQLASLLRVAEAVSGVMEFIDQRTWTAAQWAQIDKARSALAALSAPGERKASEHYDEMQRLWENGRRKKG